MQSKNPTTPTKRTRDEPWVMRTYSGHSSAKASNELYKTNLAKGQTGLSIAFDLPTQLGYNPDHPQSRGEVGKVGVPVVHLRHMEELLQGIPIDKMNTSMTINATAPWLLGLYLAMAKRQGVQYACLSGTIQNDIVKEYLSRGTFIFPPQHSRRLTIDTIAYTVRNVPKWNPINVCSYHLQEAGATPSQEIAYSLATAISILDAVRASGQVSSSDFPKVVERISFFCNSGIRFIEETAKMKTFTRLWDKLTEQRYGISDPRYRRFRYGVQVNSLGLTETQPENNIPRIVLETLGVTLAKDARARALQLPAWNEAIGLPRPWDQQWSLRIQQILAFETDLLEYQDIFEGSLVMESLISEISEQAENELDEIIEAGGVFEMIDELKARLVKSQSLRTSKIENDEITVVGVNRFTESEDSPLSSSAELHFLIADKKAEAFLIKDLNDWIAKRSKRKYEEAKNTLIRAARENTNIMEPTISFALAGGTTGEWADTLREIFGEYRAPTGLSGGAGQRRTALSHLATEAQTLAGGPPRLLVGKPGLDGHSNGAEQIAVAARDAGFEVIYDGIRLTPRQIAIAARDEDVDIVGVSILSGSHLELLGDLVKEMKNLDVDVPLVVGGIIPDKDRKLLFDLGIKAIYTPKDYKVEFMLKEMLQLVAQKRKGA